MHTGENETEYNENHVHETQTHTKEKSEYFSNRKQNAQSGFFWCTLLFFVSSVCVNLFHFNLFYLPVVKEQKITKKSLSACFSI